MPVKNHAGRKRSATKSGVRRKASPRSGPLGSRIRKATPRAKKLLKRGAKVIEQSVAVISQRAEALGNTLMKRLRSS